MAQLNVRIDDELKEKSEKLFNELGLSFSSAISIFISQAVREQALPFKVAGSKAKNITLASETVLGKDWLSPEEDRAWANL